MLYVCVIVVVIDQGLLYFELVYLKLVNVGDVNVVIEIIGEGGVLFGLFGVVVMDVNIG